MKKELLEEIILKDSEIEYDKYFGVIYKITNKINNYIYIGLTQNFKQRMLSHINLAFNNKKYNESYNKLLYRAFRKYGLDNFSFQVIHKCLTEEELYEKEKFYISKYDCSKAINKDAHGYNVTIGGEATLGYRFTDEQKKAVSKGVKAYYENKENRLKKSKSAKEAYLKNPAYREKTSQCSKKMWSNEDFKQKMIAMRQGEKHSRSKYKYYIQELSVSFCGENELIKYQQEGIIPADWKWSSIKSIFQRKGMGNSEKYKGLTLQKQILEKSA